MRKINFLFVVLLMSVPCFAQIPADITGDKICNSGIYLQGLYELQVFEIYNNNTYVNGQAGVVYTQHTSLVNPLGKPGSWNTYDIWRNRQKYSSEKNAWTYKDTGSRVYCKLQEHMD